MLVLATTHAEMMNNKVDKPEDNFDNLWILSNLYLKRPLYLANFAAHPLGC